MLRRLTAQYTNISRNRGRKAYSTPAMGCSGRKKEDSITRKSSINVAAE
jgi:hypothetical protein